MSAALRLKLRANYRVSRDAQGPPDGGRIAVHGTSADFTNSRLILDAMKCDPTGYFPDATPRYDEFYILEQKPGLPAAELYCPESGRLMHIVTDLPSMVLFVPGKRTVVPGKNGQSYSGYCAVCLEPGFEFPRSGRSGIKHFALKDRLKRLTQSYVKCYDLKKYA